MNLNSFWSQYACENTCNLEQILSKDYLTCEELLNTENIINEVKQNPIKFINFLKKNSEILKKLLDYAIDMPDEEGDDEKKLYKYPFISSEILGSNLKGIEEIFFNLNMNLIEENSENQIDMDRKDSIESPVARGRVQSKQFELKDQNNSQQQSDQQKEEFDRQQKEITSNQLLNKIFKFLTENKDIPETQAGYFAKIFSNLMTTSGELYNYVADKKEILEGFVSHVKCKNICELISRLIIHVGYHIDDKIDQFAQQREYILQLLNKKFKTGTIFEKENIQIIIQEIFSELLQQTKLNKALKTAFNLINNKCFLNTFFEVIQQQSDCGFSVGFAAQILTILVSYYNQKIKTHQSTSHEALNEKIYEEEDELIFPAAELFIENVQMIINYTKSQGNNKMETSYKQEIIPLGFGKLKMIELISNIFKSDNVQLINSLVQNGLIGNLQQLMIQYEWNNILHGYIERILTESLSIINEGKSQILEKSLFEEYNLLDFIAINSDCINQKNFLERKGFIGFLTNLARKINEGSYQKNLSKYIQNNQKWQKYQMELYGKITEKENKKLATDEEYNIIKSQKQIEDSNIEIDIQKIYQRFNDYFENKKKNPEHESLLNEDDDDNIEENNQKDNNMNNQISELKENSPIDKTNNVINTEQQNKNEPENVSSQRKSIEIKQELNKSSNIEEKRNSNPNIQLLQELFENEVKSEFIITSLIKRSNSKSQEEL